MSCFARRHENAGADDRAGAEARELNRSEHSTQAVLASHLVEQQFERFPRKELIPGRNSGALRLCEFILRAGSPHIYSQW